MADLTAAGVAPAAVLGPLAVSLGLAAPDAPVTPGQLLERFDPAALPHDPWILHPPILEMFRREDHDATSQDRES